MPDKLSKINDIVLIKWDYTSKGLDIYLKISVNINTLYFMIEIPFAEYEFALLH